MIHSLSTSPALWTDFISAVLYFFIMSITPGPNNILLTNAGANFGYLKSVKLVIGIVVGINITIGLVALGFSHLLSTYTILHTVISVLGVMFLVYLGFRVATSTKALKDTDGAKIAKEQLADRKPLSVFAMMLLQFSNIKTIIVLLSMASIYHKPTMLDTYIFLSVVSVVPVVIATNIWLTFGSVLFRFLKDPKKIRIFNTIMGSILILYSLYLLPFKDISALIT